ncbi:OLC1v1035381C1 [Oldenlandia corymbosa var. corymbosa]|uniref:OLC1v1035381C1 n=1 Tax=Oldenlandia corymbosa var. corymbosa TaxID=529605 RepID=A0AAV1CTQ5_OLDCO|nr:OLC1v1035381C1 [Oldenlandia corymbosa var. corymbosa]
MAAQNPRLLTLSIALAVASVSASAVCYYWRRKTKGGKAAKIEELEASLKSALEKCAAERQGRIKAQQALRKALVRQNSENVESNSYPMAPIAIVQSCFSTRNGTPRQPLLVPLAKACLKFDSSRVPPSSLEGLEEYSHCWILYVFHLNTDLEKIWKHPSHSKLKAKVRVPRLKGERMGLFATRTPHRPCPIGLTVGKVEAVQGHKVFLSGVDLVDGTPVLDVKPYLPYCDSVDKATVPGWVKEDKLLAVASVDFSQGFSDTLAECWPVVEKRSLYTSQDEFKGLIKQVLSWDIRSVSQRNRPHSSIAKAEPNGMPKDAAVLEKHSENDEEAENVEEVEVSTSSDYIIYHLILEGLDVSYRIDVNSNVVVEKVNHSSQAQKKQ